MKIILILIGFALGWFVLGPVLPEFRDVFSSDPEQEVSEQIAPATTSYTMTMVDYAKVSTLPRAFLKNSNNREQHKIHFQQRIRVTNFNKNHLIKLRYCAILCITSNEFHFLHPLKFRSPYWNGYILMHPFW